MSANKTVAQRLGRVLEAVTRQSGRLQETPAYGSLLLGRVSESPQRRRIRIQLILTVLVAAVNLIGIGVVLLLVTIAIPEPSVFADAPLWITFLAARLHRTGLGGGSLLDYPANRARAALGNRGPQTQPH